jgi:hypothetical protein
MVNVNIDGRKIKIYRMSDLSYYTGIVHDTHCSIVFCRHGKFPSGALSSREELLFQASTFFW